MVKEESREAENGPSKNSLFSAPSVSLPTGGGAIRSIDQKFTVNPSNGTAVQTIAVPLTPGRSGFGPQLHLTYNSGSGNGAFGLGWDLSLPVIHRKTDKGLPRYQDEVDSDTFVFSGIDDLVPFLQEGERSPRREGNCSIERFVPRIEGAFICIERCRDLLTGDVYWQSISRDNIRTVYGKNPSCRIFDPKDPGRIYSWLVEESRDDKGNIITYEYERENGENVPRDCPQERNRLAANVFSQCYLKRISYGNRAPGQAGNWAFQVLFDYGDHDFAAPGTLPDRSWGCRRDAFSTCRPGFEIRTYRLCRRILMFHAFPELGNDPVLVRSLDLAYAEDPAASRLESVVLTGYSRSPEGVPVRRSMPPLEFGYSERRVSDQIRSLSREELENAPAGVDGRKYQWVDLDGEGLAGILTGQGGGLRYQRNLGHGLFGPAQPLPTEPSTADLGNSRQQLMDLAGAGRLSLVQFAPAMAGFYERSDEGGWKEYKPFQSIPNVSLDDPNIRFVDLNGDGKADILISEEDVFVWYPSLAEEGFGSPEWASLLDDEEMGPAAVLTGVDQSIHLADMSGDGMSDIVRIRNGEICYWPNLGHGRFGARVTMDGAPHFDHPDLFDPSRIRLADIDGSGAADVIYLGRSGINIWFNQAGNGFSEPNALRVPLIVDNFAAVQTVDLMGSGTTCLVWSSPLPGEALRPIRYIDFLEGCKPYLLQTVRNNLGAETRIQYTASTRFYLDDQAAGRPWITRLPFPVHVVERVETYDRISRSRFAARYSYHHGFYDGAEREFRGFGLVEQWDTEEYETLRGSPPASTAMNLDHSSNVPPVYTKTWFHTGAFLEGEKITRQYESEYFREPGLTASQAQDILLPDSVFPEGLSPIEKMEASRSLKGSVLRQEIYGLDDTGAIARLYQVRENNCSVMRLQGRKETRHGVFFIHPSESLDLDYDLDLRTGNPPPAADPRVGHRITLEVDPFGQCERSVTIAYPRRDTSARLPEQAETRMTFSVSRFANHADPQTFYRIGLPVESRTYEIVSPPQPSSTGVPARFTLAAVRQLTEGLFPLNLVEPPRDHTWPSERWNEKPPTARLRLIEHSRMLYRKDNLEGPLGLGALESLALPYQSYKLAFTSSMLSGCFGGRVDEALLQAGGYVRFEDDDHWWAPSGRLFFSPGEADSPVEEKTAAEQGFYLPRRFRDPFGNVHRVDYDPHQLMITRITDPIFCELRVLNNYRVMQPETITDPNDNRSMVAFDALGMVAGTAVGGKAGGGQGDSLVAFEPDPDPQVTETFFSDPKGPAAATLLGNATSRIVYNLDRFHVSEDPGRPVFAATLTRERHASEPTPPGGLKIQVGFSYSDGFGRSVQTKAQVEPAHAAGGDAQDPRWLGSGWTIFNNKGNPVRTYEPFFSATHDFEFARIKGVAATRLYDPSGRVIATLHPDHTLEKVSYAPWLQTIYDANDAVMIDPLEDPDLRDHFSRLHKADYLPTWHGLRTDPALAAAAWPDPDKQDAERSAALKASRHAETPGIAHMDTLGRVFLSVADNGPDTLGRPQKYETRVTLDIQGRQRVVVDPLGRDVKTSDFDLLGRAIRQGSIDAGKRWALHDVSGKLLRTWDERDHEFGFCYDALRRPLESRVMGGDGPAPLDHVFEKIVYGEGQSLEDKSDKDLNLRGKVFRHYDTAGRLQFGPYDFKGNPLREERRFALDYKRTPDWGAPGCDALLEAASLRTEWEYDALNRVIRSLTPDGSVVLPEYDAAGLLDKVSVDQSGRVTEFVRDIDYNEKGQRSAIAYGNGASTSYAYDEKTFKLIRILSRRSGGELLQALDYTYDPVGNVTRVEDRARPTVFFGNCETRPVNQYTYDPLYRLIEAQGREHIPQTNSGNEDLWNDLPFLKRYGLNDPMAWRNYTQSHAYDAVGNLSGVSHAANGGSWTRSYSYESGANRLQSLTMGDGTGTSGVFRYTHHPRHGFMEEMPHLQVMQWNFKDELQAAAQQRRTDGGLPETTYYVYDADGRRVRKVTETTAAPGASARKKSERVYVGGVEIYREHGTLCDGLERVTLHVMDDRTRIAMIETRNEVDDGTPARLVRYQMHNSVGSVCLETDEHGKVISYEEFHPYGSTAYQAVERDVRAANKRYRYAGKERDEESGLYYHGARYYAPWLGRWISPDPLGIKDGLNVYAFCRNNPVNNIDLNGMDSADAGVLTEPDVYPDAGDAGSPSPVAGYALPEKEEWAKSPVAGYYKKPKERDQSSGPMSLTVAGLETMNAGVMAIVIGGVILTGPVGVVGGLVAALLIGGGAVAVGGGAAVVGLDVAGKSGEARSVLGATELTFQLSSPGGMTGGMLGLLVTQDLEGLGKGAILGQTLEFAGLAAYGIYRLRKFQFVEPMETILLNEKGPYGMTVEDGLEIGISRKLYDFNLYSPTEMLITRAHERGHAGVRQFLGKERGTLLWTNSDLWRASEEIAVETRALWRYQEYGRIPSEGFVRPFAVPDYQLSFGKMALEASALATLADVKLGLKLRSRHSRGELAKGDYGGCQEGYEERD